MVRRTVVAAALVLAAAAPARAAKIPQDFRAEFEKTFRKGRTFAVVAREGVPTTSIYGVKGDSDGTAHYSVDVVDGEWKPSQGLLDFDQTAADFLNEGEVMELNSISWKDDRLDMRFVSLEAHKVTRGDLFKSTKREPVATNFKFFFPFAITGAADVRKAIDYIEDYLRPYQSESEARAAAAKMVSGGGERRASAPARRSSGEPTKKEIKAGMTPLEVMDILGKPEKEVSFENKSRWTYPDLTVVFENGRVKEVKF